MKKMKLLFAITTCLCSSTFAAVSIPTGWYLEGNLGSARSYHAVYATPGTTSDEKGFGWNVDGGFKFTSYFGLEVGYTNYNNANVDYNNTKIADSTRYAFDIAGKGIMTFFSTDLELFGKLGVARLSADVSVSNQNVINANNISVKNGTQTSNCLYYALGADYVFTQNIAANIQWARANGNSDTGKLDLISLGITYIFN